MADTQQAQFSIEKIYVKDLSLEVPNAPQVFLQRDQPEVQVQLHTEGSGVDEGVFQCLLTVTVTAKLGDKTMFLVEAAQGGIFQIRNVPQQDLEPILSIACPNILFPYVRETISDTINRAGFPPVLLAPVNFEALYQQRLEQVAQQPAAPLQ
ncbi:MAG: protein-export chaperone SecB [Candidatus Methylophosphatis roskildensis]|uniref:Protein-export protein SecB n=1 Tax=Candidatus Methylophosphatis roskildensis TaxID=2899263 RepID=A0A9D7E237_9PROT|nr:protein-export chaperone SecB [Candidatus Methylophosphatis roskildensis]MBK7234390.1 protein-export chaperone SecB [Sterolibacteriaceae bacterium]MBK7662299.1 protein-export chaperone SecB [Sterolibacteriaceae bacterium]MBK9086413.1 protein-export chaperone SecB [Sterolibacteriaceae bacterium]